MPKISVLMSVYNNNKYLTEAIDSVLSQSFSDFEFIIVDDGSTDGASETLDRYASEDKRIVLIKNETNIGLIKSLNKGLNAAKGKYVARMDGDDICFPDRFQKQVEYLDKNIEIALVYSDTLLIDKDSNEMCRSYRPLSVEKVIRILEIHDFIPHPTVMFRLTIIAALGGYTDNEYCKNREDQDLWIRMRDSGYLFGYINEILLKYRSNPNSVQRTNSDNYWFNVAKECQWNNSRFASFRYWKKLTLLQKLEIFVRSFVPFFIFKRRLEEKTYK